ncbi:MAG: ribonuclease P protein component [Actinomycetota bacterium]|nr:ribonuclease P protein component [Actinomycetota bacterium]
MTAPLTPPRVTGRHRVWRVQRRSSFENFGRGRRGRAGPITVSWVPGQPTEPPRVAYAIGKRVGPAVVRNRLRRRLRMIVREVAPTLPPGAYLIGAGPPAALSSYDELRTMVPQAIAISTRARRAGEVRERR